MGTVLAVAMVLLLAWPNRAAQIDEVKHWTERSAAFLDAMGRGAFGETAQTEHPGVTVMAVGALGHLLRGAVDPDGALSPTTQLQIIRLPLHLLHVALWLWAYVLLSQILSPRMAALTVGLWALSPFLRWHHHLLHVTGLNTDFIVLALLLMWHALPNDGPIRWRGVVVAGAMAGLATLTRFSSVVVVGPMVLLALLSASGSVRQRVVRAVGPSLVVVVMLLVMWVALYPAMWTDAGAVIAQTLHGIQNAGSDHENYFMGEPTGNPAPTFYGVVLAVRTAPWVVPLMLLGLWQLAAHRPTTWRGWVMVAVFALGYTLMLSLQTKKLERYITPVLAVMMLWAAVGADWLWARMGRGVRWALVVGVVAYSLWYWPYDYTHANPLTGGAATLDRAFMVGGGEGLHLVADYLRDNSGQPEACHQYVYTAYAGVLEVYLPCAFVVNLSTISEDKVGNAYYIVRYISYRQRGPHHDDWFAQLTPLYTVERRGLTLAEVYDAEALRVILRREEADSAD